MTAAGPGNPPGVPVAQTAAILLAAGLSRRYPGEKLTADLHGKPLFEHAAGLLAALPFQVRIAVVGPDAPHARRLAELGFEIVTNPAPQRGQGGSLAAGAAAAAAHSPAAVLLMLADMPFVPEAHLRGLLARIDPADPDSLAFSQSGGAEGGWRGPPAAFHAGFLPRLARARADEGARPILRAAPETAGIAVPEVWLADFDSPADFARAAAGETLP